MARAEGEAYKTSLDYMVDNVAGSGAKQRAGDYIVAYAQERAEGMYGLQKEGTLAWVEPDGENCHLEVSVSDAADGRFIPGLAIEATLIPEHGEPIGPFEVPFVWYPGLYHYRRNIQVQGRDRYDLHIKIAPPEFMRHDKDNGRRYASTIEVDFLGIEVSPGKD